MKHLTTYLSKISRTKKKLSNEQWPLWSICIALFGLLTVLSFAVRAVSLPFRYSVVAAEIPVLPAAVNDPAAHGFKEQAVDSISNNTAAVVLTTGAFYFGGVQAFTGGFGADEGRYVINHVDGEPQLEELIATMGRWVSDRARGQNIPNDKIIVFAPAGDIPMPIVTQVLAGLNTAGFARHVILAAGLK